MNDIYENQTVYQAVACRPEVSHINILHVDTRVFFFNLGESWQN